VIRRTTRRCSERTDARRLLSQSGASPSPPVLAQCDQQCFREHAIWVKQMLAHVDRGSDSRESGVLATFHNRSGRSDGRPTISDIYALADRSGVDLPGLSGHICVLPDGTWPDWSLHDRGPSRRAKRSDRLHENNPRVVFHQPATKCSRLVQAGKFFMRRSRPRFSARSRARSGVAPAVSPSALAPSETT
jgi:hypothetical protein